MTHRVHVTMEVELFIDDVDAFRQAAFERMHHAWRSEDDFPFDAPVDVPLGQAVQSLLADAVPLDLPGARRSQLVMETEDVEEDVDQHEEAPSEDDRDDDQSEPEGDDEVAEADDRT
ncbi:MAG: hypothetical protein WAK18_13230 [Nocardioidaceae bacterium]